MSLLQTLRNAPRHLWERLTVLRYAAASGVASATDWALFLLLAQVILPEGANVISYGTAMLVNFTMHRRVVFRDIRRGVMTSFVISMGLSVIGLLLNTLTLYLVRLALPDQLIVPKLVATVLVFIYNYNSKKHLAFGVARTATPAPVPPASGGPAAPSAGQAEP